MTDDLIMREVNDAIRRDRAKDAWERNKMTLLALAIAVVIGTAGGQLYRSMKDGHNADMTNELLTAQRLLETGKAAEAAAAFGKTAEAQKGEQKALLQIWQARALITAGEEAKAKEVLADIIAHAKKDGTWRDLACVWTAGLGDLLPKECDTNTATPFARMKHELAAADAIAARDYTTARTQLAKLKGGNVTPEQQARAMQLELLLPPEQAAKADPLKTPAE